MNTTRDVEVVLVGGPKDGARLTLPNPLHKELIVPLIKPTQMVDPDVMVARQSLPVKTAKYLQERITSVDGRVLHFYRYENLTTGGAMEALLHGYGRAVGGGE